MNSSSNTDSDDIDIFTSLGPVEVEETKASASNINISEKFGKPHVNKHLIHNNITSQDIDSNEEQLKERIAQCRSIIESLKSELHNEKLKLDKNKSPQQEVCLPKATSVLCDSSEKRAQCILEKRDPLSTCLSSTLNCDEHLIEYEKQLQRYQNTLNMAQIEKKNAIRKQMLTKAFHLKLLEVENQCNIELLRVKQSLQCLEPLRMIANNWKTTTECGYDLSSFELIPRYPEYNFDVLTDFNRPRDDIEMKKEEKGSTTGTFENISSHD